eukprot:CFRG7773T1
MPVASSDDKVLADIRKLPQNKICPNCLAKSTIGHAHVCIPFKTFVCSDCKSAHQAFSHRIKTINMSTFTHDEVENLRPENGGSNDACDRAYFGRYSSHRLQRPRKGDDHTVWKDFVQRVYIKKEFLDDNGDGPSRDHSSTSDDRNKRSTQRSFDRMDNRHRDDSFDSEDDYHYTKRSTSRNAGGRSADEGGTRSYNRSGRDVSSTTTKDRDGEDGSSGHRDGDERDEYSNRMGGARKFDDRERRPGGGVVGAIHKNVSSENHLSNRYSSVQDGRSPSPHRKSRAGGRRRDGDEEVRTRRKDAVKSRSRMTHGISRDDAGASRLPSENDGRSPNIAPVDVDLLNDDVINGAAIGRVSLGGDTDFDDWDSFQGGDEVPAFSPVDNFIGDPLATQSTSNPKNDILAMFNTPVATQPASPLLSGFAGTGATPANAPVNPMASFGRTMNSTPAHAYGMGMGMGGINTAMNACTPYTTSRSSYGVPAQSPGMSRGLGVGRGIGVGMTASGVSVQQKTPLHGRANCTQFGFGATSAPLVPATESTGWSINSNVRPNNSAPKKFDGAFNDLNW